MNALHNDVVISRPLEALGISETEELAYRALLARPMATNAQIARRLGLPPHESQMLLDSIEAKGLATRSPEHPGHYMGASPELGIELLIRQRQVVLEHARAAIPGLTQQVRPSADMQERGHLVEVITDRAALKQIIRQLINTAHNELLNFQRAPLIHPEIGFVDGINSSVQRRCISDSSLLDSPGGIERIRQDVASGEDSRVFPTLPFKMLIADGRVGLISLDASDTTGPMLLVRNCALLDALALLFEFIWERATPISFSQNGAMTRGKIAARISEVAEQIVPMLASGLNDKAIAHEAGISSATLNRRIAELMKSFDTRTRFQLGWRAALHVFSGQFDADTQNK